MFIKYCVFSKILKYIPDSGLSRFQFVYTMASQTPSAAAAELAEFRKITTFLGKTQYLMNNLKLLLPGRGSYACSARPDHENTGWHPGCNNTQISHNTPEPASVSGIFPNFIPWALGMLPRRNHIQDGVEVWEHEKSYQLLLF